MTTPPPSPAADTPEAPAEGAPPPASATATAAAAGADAPAEAGTAAPAPRRHLRSALQTLVALLAAVPVAMLASPLVASAALQLEPVTGAMTLALYRTAIGAIVAAGSLIFAWQVVRDGRPPLSAGLFLAGTATAMLALALTTGDEPVGFLAGVAGLALGTSWALRRERRRARRRRRRA